MTKKDKRFNIFNRSKKRLPGMTTGEQTVYKEGETRTQDSIYRDIYENMRKVRGNKQEVTSRIYVPVGAGVAGGLSAGLLFLGLPALYTKGYSLLLNFDLVSGKQLEYWGAFKTLLYGSIGSPFLYALSFGVGALAYAKLLRYWKQQNLNIIHTDIDTYESDSYIQLPEQLPYSYDIFPDAGAHSSVSPTAILSHMMFSEKGLPKISVPKRYEEDTEVVFIDENSETEEIVVMKKGDYVLDENEDLEYENKALIDEEFGHKLFKSSLIPESVRHFFDTTKLLYNPKKVRDKNEVDTIAEHIKDDWEFPEYETQRPAGAYVVDTEPNNTMVLAMTRAGKGQTIIEPTLDMWTREKELNNFAANDPKGELYVKFYYPATKRGYDVVAFNLINPSSTNIYNPLGYAVDAARQGDNQKVEEFVSSIGDVFFPTENADDPMWPNAANAAFKRSALGLIDYYQEEDRQYRIIATENKTPVGVVDQYLDEMWGRVTLYNVYQMMTELASKKSSDPNKIHVGADDISKEKDFLTLFFDATAKLPRNALRTSTMNQDNSLRAMAGSDKTIASVYGISLTAMLFFAGEKISRLTSGRPSQNFDMVGLGFPRRIGVRFDKSYMDKNNLLGQRTKWTAYRNADFTDQYKGSDFAHESKIDSNGWSFYYFKGIFEENKTYLKLEVFDVVSNLRAKQYYFVFEKDYQKSLNGRTYVYDPVHKKMIIHNGTLQELIKTKVSIRDDEGNQTIKYEYKKGKTMVAKKRIPLTKKSVEEKKRDVKPKKSPVFIQNEVRYKEKPKGIFFITPPHLMEYAKIILILMNQMFNMQVDKAYLTKANQKPLYKTRYMLDEVGNLQSEGNGIPYLNTKASIGLGQEQQYTLILQTLQQLKDVYGESVDKILQGNTGNILYLKSTDDSMLETLEGMAGTLHEAFKDSKAVTNDVAAMVGSVDGKVTYTTTMQEKPTISKKDMLNIPKANAMVFGKGHPIWARNEMALPMSYQLHENQLVDPETGKYALANVPTTSNTDDFDILANKPDFFRMVEKRVDQARRAEEIKERYMKVHNLSEYELSKINPEMLSEELMRGINEVILEELNLKKEVADEQEEPGAGDGDYEAVENEIYSGSGFNQNLEVNTDFVQAVESGKVAKEKATKKIYANYSLGKEDIFKGKANESLSAKISEVYRQLIGQFDGQEFANGTFSVNADTELYHNNRLMIKNISKEAEKLRETDNTGDVRMTPDSDKDADLTSVLIYEATPEFYKLLVSVDDWNDLLNGEFDRLMGIEFNK